MPRTIVALLALLMPVIAQAADKRVALVIGNSAYRHSGALANPKNDATDVAARPCGSLALQLSKASISTRLSFDRKIRDFAKALQGADAGILFYAGHGLQVGGENYLVPVDAELSSVSALDFEMVRVGVVQRIMEGEAGTNVLFLDACRDNPLARNLARAMGTRSTAIGRGLSTIESGSGTLISFSTQPGNVALDGTGRNSPFAGALVKYMSSSTDDLSAILIAVRNDVMKETQRKQVPWEHSALTGRFFFNRLPQTAAAALPAGLSDLQLEIALWHGIKDSRSPELVQVYLDRYPNGTFSAVARLAIEQMKSAVVTPKVPAPLPVSSQAPPARTMVVKVELAAAPKGKPRGFMGITITALQSEWARTFGLAQKAVWVTAVAPDGPAAKAKVQPGDVIVRFDGREVHDARSMARLVGEMPPDASPMVEIWRVGESTAELQDLAPRSRRSRRSRGNSKSGLRLHDPMFGAADDAEALRWNCKSADMGDATAMRMLGVMHRDGRGLPKDEPEAVRWFHKSAQAGDAVAMRSLATMYLEGAGTSRDPAAGAQWTVKALRAGDSRSLADMSAKFNAWGEEFRRELQRNLKDAGFYDGPLDGSYSPATQQAIEILMQRTKRGFAQ